MPEKFQRVSPLADIAIQGRFGADHGAPGVTLSVRHSALIATVIASKGRAKALAESLKPAAAPQETGRGGPPDPSDTRCRQTATSVVK